MCGVIYSQMVLQGESPDPVTLVPLLVEGTERKMNDPAALCLMALGSQFVGGILHWPLALPYKPSAGIQWRHLQEGCREGTQRDQAASGTLWFQSVILAPALQSLGRSDKLIFMRTSELTLEVRGLVTKSDYLSSITRTHAIERG